MDDLMTTDMKWYQVWWHVWTHPGPEAFRTILRDSQAKSGRGFLWIAVTSVLSYLAYVVFLWGSSINAMLIYWICVIIAGSVVGIIGLAISAGIYRVIAGLLGGSGTWDKLVYCFAAITAPTSVLAIPAFLMMIILAPFFYDPRSPSLLASPGYCLATLIGFAVGIYTLVLFVSAIAAVENITTGKAVLIFFIPVLVGIALVICLVIVGIIPAIISTMQGFYHQS